VSIEGILPCDHWYSWFKEGRMHRTSTRPALALIQVLLAGCGGSSGDVAPSAPTAPIATIDEPTTLDLYPNESSDNPARLTVMVTAVGSVPVSMPLGFDTGSAGITLYAPSIWFLSRPSRAGLALRALQGQLWCRVRSNLRVDFRPARPPTLAPAMWSVY
jgi:hypothetical protein